MQRTAQTVQLVISAISLSFKLSLPYSLLLIMV